MELILPDALEYLPGGDDKSRHNGKKKLDAEIHDEPRAGCQDNRHRNTAQELPAPIGPGQHQADNDAAAFIGLRVIRHKHGHTDKDDGRHGKVNVKPARHGGIVRQKARFTERRIETVHLFSFSCAARLERNARMSVAQSANFSRSSGRSLSPASLAV